MEYISKITASPGEGCTRFSYSEEDRQVREYLFKIMKYLGLSIKVDGVGNIRAKYIDGNSEQPSIMIGSHIDTVANGGKFDGLAGVVTALEAIRVIKENKISLNNPVELVVFSEEEGSNFGITMLGSKVLTGVYDIDDLKQIVNDNGICSYQLMKEFGLNVEKVGQQTLQKGEIKAMIELHVEQGEVLDSENIPIGIVKAIAGMRTYKVTLKGVSNHAGSTPMHLRSDPMVGAAEIITHIERAVKELALPSTVATVGKILCYPNAINVIPGKIEFFVDVRDVEMEGIELIADEIQGKIKEVVKTYGLDGTIDLVGESSSVALSGKIIDTIEKTAKEKGYKYKLMNSGAVHDSAMLTGLTEVGMIFVPSIAGKSHCPDEATNYEDIKLGCDLLVDTIIKLSNK